MTEIDDFVAMRRVGDMCGEYLMEDGWEEGFECVLPFMHGGDHIAKTAVESLEGTHKDGRKYEYEYHWRYVQ